MEIKRIEITSCTSSLLRRCSPRAHFNKLLPRLGLKLITTQSLLGWKDGLLIHARFPGSGGGRCIQPGYCILFDLQPPAPSTAIIDDDDALPLARCLLGYPHNILSFFALGAGGCAWAGDPCKAML